MKSEVDIWLIHCAGKVGSVSLTRALAKAGLTKGSRKIYKTHVLNREKLQRTKVNVDNGGHLASSVEFLDRFDGGSYERCCVIIGRRDPIAQAVSAFFQNILLYTQKEEITLSDLDLVVECLRERVRNLVELNTSTWWETEVEDVFHVDVLSFPFDKDSGVSCVHLSDQLTFLLYTVERGLNNLSEQLEAISGVSPIDIQRLNTVSDNRTHKPYSNHEEIKDIYNQVLSTFRLPADYLEDVYSRRSCTFFYDADQISQFKARWRDSD